MSSSHHRRYLIDLALVAHSLSAEPDLQAAERALAHLAGHLRYSLPARKPPHKCADCDAETGILMGRGGPEAEDLLPHTEALFLSRFCRYLTLHYPVMGQSDEQLDAAHDFFRRSPLGDICDLLMCKHVCYDPRDVVYVGSQADWKDFIHDDFFPASLRYTLN